jgi:hypothetical protein
VNYYVSLQNKLQKQYIIAILLFGKKPRIYCSEKIFKTGLTKTQIVPNLLYRDTRNFCLQGDVRNNSIINCDPNSNLTDKALKCRSQEDVDGLTFLI